jgi:hypothetical protein
MNNLDWRDVAAIIIAEIGAILLGYWFIINYQ